MKPGLGIIGMGVQGRRMLSRLPEHGRLRAVAAWDPDPGRLEATGLARASGAEELVRMPGVDCVYIASPPDVHLAQSNLAFDAGKPVLCEKPLATRFDEARATIGRIEREKHRAAVNFSLAASAGLAALLRTVEQGEAGELRAVEIEVRFREWPRAWQAGAGRWLAERREGGFTREVLSHFVFALQRALGKAVVERSSVRWPAEGEGAEAGLAAGLRAGAVPVRIDGAVAGDAADFNRFALVGDRATVEFREWLTSRRPAGAGAFEPVDSGGRPAYLRQLDHVVDFIEGRPNALPDFAEALAVQETIEAMLSSRS